RVADSPAFLHLELGVENGTGGLAPARPLTWQVEYPGQDPEAQKDKLVWESQVADRDVRALVPLVQVGDTPTSIPHAPPAPSFHPKCSPSDGGPLRRPGKTGGCGGRGLSPHALVMCVCPPLSPMALCSPAPAEPPRTRDTVPCPTELLRMHTPARLSPHALMTHVPALLSPHALMTHVPAPLSPMALAPGEAEEPGEEEAEQRRARGCRPQYQRTALRVLAHFVAHPLDGGRHLAYLPGHEWLLDVTHLVANRTRV
ncbi:T132A protein, partial [Rynchops niger]|nr:T132A protein [Rynchops niger]